MAIAAWRVWRTDSSASRLEALTVFGLQLAFNLFWRIERLAEWLLFPYLLWVAFAAALNLSIWLLN